MIRLVHWSRPDPLCRIREPCVRSTRPFALPHQRFDRNTVVQRVAGNYPGRGIDGLCFPVTTQQPLDAYVGRQPGIFFDDSAIGPAEADAAVDVAFDAESAFVHQRVMMAAEQNEIVDRGFATFCPIPNVMRIDEALMAASRESAAAVARLQGPAQRWRHGSGLAADIEWIARAIFRYP